MSRREDYNSPPPISSEKYTLSPITKDSTTITRQDLFCAIALHALIQSEPAAIAVVHARELADKMCAELK